jgi:hypothetical protein
MLRVRFKSSAQDPRPVNWPVKHPYWISGWEMGEEQKAVLISYADDEAYIFENWPEAEDLEIQERSEYTFTERFPRPEWFEESRP